MQRIFLVDFMLFSSVQYNEPLKSDNFSPKTDNFLPKSDIFLNMNVRPKIC